MIVKIFVIAILIIFTYTLVTKKLISKGNTSKIAKFSGGFISIIVAIIIIGITSPSSSYDTKKNTTEDTKEYHVTSIDKTLTIDPKNSLEMKYYSELISIPENTAERSLAEDAFVEYGIGYSQMTAIIANGQCSAPFNIQSKPIEKASAKLLDDYYQILHSFQKDHNGDSIPSGLKNSYESALTRLQDQYNELAFKMSLCYFNKAQSLPEHLPRNEPVYKKSKPASL